jgi:hypothetical protein
MTARARAGTQWRIVLRCWRALLAYDLHVAVRGFESIYNRLRDMPLGPIVAHASSSGSSDSSDSSNTIVVTIANALDAACALYWKRVLCLQRSVVCALVLKRAGVPAELVIGMRRMPIGGHAWVELDGQIVTDLDHVHADYVVLDRV